VSTSELAATISLSLLLKVAVREIYAIDEWGHGVAQFAPPMYYGNWHNDEYMQRNSQLFLNKAESMPTEGQYQSVVQLWTNERTLLSPIPVRCKQ